MEKPFPKIHSSWKSCSQKCKAYGKAVPKRQSSWKRHSQKAQFLEKPFQKCKVRRKAVPKQQSSQKGKAHQKLFPKGKAHGKNVLKNAKLMEKLLPKMQSSAITRGVDGRSLIIIARRRRSNKGQLIIIIWARGCVFFFEAPFWESLESRWVQLGLVLGLRCLGVALP